MMHALQIQSKCHLVTMIGCALSTVFVAVSLAASPGGGKADSPIPVDETNDYYISNRLPLVPSPLIKLPIGSIAPDGWLKHQLELEADGFIGHLQEFSRWCKYEGSSWISPTGEGEHGWEEMPYWLKGFADIGYILRDDRILADSRKWIEGILRTQREDGYFGPESNRKNLDLWPNMIALYVLRSYHEATGDERVIPFMKNYFRWMMTVDLGRFLPGSWQKWRAADNLDSIHWLYNRTGEDWLLEAARVNHEFTAPWSSTIPTWHGVNLCQCFRGPAQYYQQTGDVRYLDATIRNYDTFMGIYGQVPGGMFGADENCREGYVGPRQAAESCSMVEFMHSFEMLTRITGNPIWADRCEEVAHNSLPASMTPDLKGLHYLTAPNQIQLDRQNKSPMIQNRGDMFSYTPYSYRCCQHNVAFGWPYYAEHLWMATPGNGLAASLYAASTVKARVGDGTEVTITEKTDYPFSDQIEFIVGTDRPVQFPLLLRIPAWTRGGFVEVNGVSSSVASLPLSWRKIERTWANGDTVKLTLPMQITTRVWSKNKNTVSVYRGPLAYSLKIKERWQRYESGGDWAAYEVFPDSPWNYGLIVDHKAPGESFTVVEQEGPLPRQPFTTDNAPVMLKAKAKRIPQWKQETNGLVGAVQEGPVRCDQPVEEIVLIPMGCARLRISSFPQIGEGPDAKEWNTATVSVQASHVSDQITAVHDNTVGNSSGDASVPRFTWWPRRGTAEWIQYDYATPKGLSWCEVYWYDDTGRGSCRVPKSWKLLFHDGTDWKPVPGADKYGTKTDQYNRVEFQAVKTKALRLQVEFRPEFSGGILEWRAGG